MSEKLPYEEQLNKTWDDLPLPDENMAWKDMRRRLDEDDDEKIVVPPPGRGCGIGAILIGLLLLGGFWLLVRPEKWFMSQKAETVQQTKTENEQNDPGEEMQKISKDDKEITPEKTTEQNREDNSNVETKNDSAVKKVNDNSATTSLQNTDEKKNETEVEIKTVDAAVTKRKPQVTNKNDKTSNKTPVSSNKKRNTRSEKNIVSKNEEALPGNKNVSIEYVKSDTIVANNKDNQLIQNDSIETKTDSIPIIPKKDSTIIKTTDSVAEKKPDQIKKETAPLNKKEREKKPVFFSAGIGLHQQIPVGGQEWTSYGSLGRKGLISDYIPSINFRMERENRWFLQTEFRYGAPQHTKQFTYSQKISIDTFTQSVITNSSSLKKTFYHQLPLTFNYYIFPNWSIGTGLQWNKFYSAVAEQDVRRRRPGTIIDSIISKNIVKVSNDSSTALVKSWWQGVVQTQYQWKRFSIGARYSFGLQPYIKFALPGQPLQEEKNSSLQIFLRYELWKSKK